jgi:hypothetical protein
LRQGIEASDKYCRSRAKQVHGNDIAKAVFCTAKVNFGGAVLPNAIVS